MKDKILKAFDGTLNTQPVKVRIKFYEKRWVAFVGMGEIRIPTSKTGIGIEQIENECKCKIKRNGSGVSVIPNVVSEIIERDGFLSSACDEHRSRLREWMKNYGIRVLRHLVGLE